MTGRITTNGHGSRAVRVISIAYGLGIISTESEARSRRAFYPVVTTSSSFGMDIAFVSWEEREAFNQWLARWMRAVTTKAGTDGYMRIEVPGRRFTRTAVLDNGSGPTYGEAVTDVGYKVHLDFCGASDPIDSAIEIRRMLSVFRLPDEGRKQARHFYPGGKQVKGAASLEGTLFDQTEEEVIRPETTTPAKPPPKSLDQIAEERGWW